MEKVLEVGYLALYKISTRNISTCTRETTRNTTFHSVCVCEREGEEGGGLEEIKLIHKGLRNS
jgi:hypothetical protein